MYPLYNPYKPLRLLVSVYSLQLFSLELIECFLQHAALPHKVGRRVFVPVLGFVECLRGSSRTLVTVYELWSYISKLLKKGLYRGGL